jgi:nucleotide-binding universal stress UspA family protein
MKRLSSILAEDLDVTREVRIGVPARDLAAAADDVGADVIVVASHGYGPIRRAMYGSVTSALLRVSKCPVLVVANGKKVVDFSAVVAGVDLSPVSEKVVAAAVAYTAKGGRTELITAYEPPVVMDADEDLLPRIPTPEDKAKLRADREAEIRRLIPNDADVRTINVDAFAKAPPANAILDCAELLEADLLVVGTSGHSAWHRAFLGSTAMRVLAQARCPVLLVPHAG